MKPLNASARRGLACLLLACLPAAAGAADNAPEPAQAAPAPAPPDLNLRIERYASSIGSDGVQRETRYADLMYRRADLVWIERDYPAALRASVEHGHDGHAGQDPHAGHSHANTTGSPLWVRRDAAGKDQVRMVLRKQHKVLDIDEANYGSVGYNGSWAATHGVADPRQFSACSPKARRPKACSATARRAANRRSSSTGISRGSTRAGSRSKARTASRSAGSR